MFKYISEKCPCLCKFLPIWKIGKLESRKKFLCCNSRQNKKKTLGPEWKLKWIGWNVSFSISLWIELELCDNITCVHLAKDVIIADQIQRKWKRLYACMLYIYAHWWRPFFGTLACQSFKCSVFGFLPSTTIFFWQKGSWQKCNWGSHILNLLMSAIDKVFRKKGLFCLLPPFPAQKKREVIQHWPYKKLSEHPFPQILSLSPNIISHLYKSYLHQWFKFKSKMRRWMKGMGSFDGTGAFAFAPQSHFD